MDKNIDYLSVSTLNKYIEKKYNYDPYLKEIYLKGEISNCKLHSNGNLYFTIKDNFSKIDATKYNGREYANLKEGDTVYLKASLNFFLGYGQQRLNVSEIKRDKIGDLYRKLVELREKLNEEGLFLSKHKKSIPKFCQNIAVITSDTGAAIQDIKRTILRRYPIAQINIYPSLVQGEQAINDILKNIKLADNENNDVIILARGGGSIEDLWCFNSEEVARAVFNCKTPVITGVGHETDTTLVDFVSDIRASTPTAAAEISTFYTIDDIKENLFIIEKRILELFNNTLIRKKEFLNNYKNNYYIKHYTNKFITLNKLIKNTENNINILMKNKLGINKINLNNKTLLFKNIDILDRYNILFENYIKLLENNSPLNILNKGYSILLNKKDEKITSINQVNKNDEVKIKLKDGMLKAKIT